jgi:nucleoid-associated protein YgaU
MTRENKLAMVVGFGLLLFVGILVSDHFSTAQRQGSANLDRPDPSRIRVARQISIAPIAGATTVQTTEVMAANTSNDVRPTSNLIAAPQQEAPRTTGVRPISNVPNTAPETVIASAEKSKTTKVQESEPGVQLHPIAEGETLYSICAKEYGDGSLWKELAEYNKKALPNAAKLRKGVTLRLPPVEQLRRGAVLASTVKGARVSVTPQEQEGAALHGSANLNSKFNEQAPLLAAADIASVEMSPTKTGAQGGVIEVVVANAKPAATKTSTQVTSNQANKSATATTYVVQKGDTLSSIAKNKLGKTSRWKEIADANGSTLSNPTALSPGMSIQIPQTN